METKRLFVAVNVPESLREKISREFLSEKPSGIKAVEKENLHITLCFLGNCSKEQEKETIRAMEGIQEKRFEIALSGISHFGKKVVFIKVTNGKKELESVSNFLSERMPFASKNFHAHLTIARNKKMPAKEFGKELQRLSQKRFEERFTLKSIDLMQSGLSPKGPVYRKVFEKRLGEKQVQ